mgnify:CR=1 FL=1
MNNSFDGIQAARKVFDTEIDALTKTRDALGSDFEDLVQLVVNCQGKVILTGMGKPGHIATKIAASLASLGTPSFFMHPAEAMHGDLGMIDHKDVVVLMSYSGESQEVTALLPVLTEIGCTTVAITGNAKSTLDNACSPRFEEACFLHLAPTSSTTSLLVLGDALAVVASRFRNYTKEDFGLHHPAGSLGKKLLVKVKNLMHTEQENAVVISGSSLREAIIVMSAKALSMVTVVDTNSHLLGIITDGDLRRMLERGIDVYHETIDHVMTKNPISIDYRERAVDALQIMNNRNITCLPVVDEKNLVVGSLLMQDILKAGIV